MKNRRRRQRSRQRKLNNPHNRYKHKTQPLPLLPKKQKRNEGNRGKAEEAKRITGKTSNKSKNSYKDFEKQVGSFDKQEYAGKRHMVFITDAIYNTLQVIYGDKRISAVFNSLAQNHIDAYKEEMRNSFKSRSVLFQND